MADQWEYLTAILSNGQNGKAVRYVNGDQIQGWPNVPHYSVYFNQLGAQGWELAGVGKENGSYGEGEAMLFFKRRKS